MGKLEAAAYCPRCGNGVDHEGLVCHHCGRDLYAPPPSGDVKLCKGCGRENPAGDGYCQHCGRPREDLVEGQNPIAKIFGYLKYLKYVRIAVALIVLALFLLIMIPGINQTPTNSNGVLPTLAGQDYYFGSGNETYQWTYYAVRFHLSLSIDPASLASYRANNEYREAGGISFAMDNIPMVATHSDPLIMQMALDFQVAKTKLKIGPYHLINLMLSFVQSLSNADDINSTGYQEYWRFPVETLADRQGDMIDKSLLLASLTKACGYETAILLDGRGVGWSQSHTSVGVCCSGAFGTYYENAGNKYFVCEPSCPGYKMGDVSPDNQRSYTVPVF